MQTLGTFDYLALAIYMFVMAGIGVVLGSRIKNVGAYFKGGGTLPWPAAAISNYMSMFSTFIFVAYAGIAYEHGLVAVTVIWCTVPPALLAAGFMAKRWRRAGIMTPVEYLETRFNSPVRQFFSWGGIGFRVLDNMVRLYAIGVFISAVTPLSLEKSIFAAGAVVVLYTVAGGLWAVVLTDALQFVVLIFAALILVPLSVQAAGGLPAMFEADPEHFSLFRGPKGAPLFLLAYYTMVLIKYNGNWSFIQRFYSVRDEAAGRKVGLLMAALFFVFPIFFLLPAMAARVVKPDLADPEMAYATMALHVLPEGIMGLLMAAMFAATMSAVDSELNVTAGVFTRDVYHRLLRPKASGPELMWIGRGATVVIGGLIVAGALFVGAFGGAFEANKILTGLAIPLSVPLVLGVLVRRARPWGAFASVIAGVAAGVALNFHSGISWPVATLTVVGVSVGTMLLSGLLPSRNTVYQAKVRAFFSRLETPVSESEKPEPDPRFQVAMRQVFAIALGCTGVLFVGMSLLSIRQLGGILALASGLICLLLTAVVFASVSRLNLTNADSE